MLETNLWNMKLRVCRGCDVRSSYNNKRHLTSGNPLKNPPFHFQEMLQEMFWKNFWQKRLSESHGYVKLLPLSSTRGAFRCLRCFHQVIDVNVKVVIELDEVDRGLSFHLMNNHASSFWAVLFGIFHLLPHEAVHDLSGLTLRWGRVVCDAWE